MISNVVAVLGALALVSGIQSYTLPKPVVKPNYWFSFGDSYTSTSFNITTGPLPSTANPFGNPPPNGYTACGYGPNITNWIDDMTLTYNNSLIYTYNLAYGGATINATLVAPYQPTVLSLIDQVDEFLVNLGSHPKTAPWTSANSLFSFFIGINDMGGSWWLPGDRGVFADLLLDQYFALVEKVFKTGARNFLFINVPGVDQSPYVASLDGAADYAIPMLNQAILQFNAKLAERVKKFKSTHFGVTTRFYDSHTRLLDIIEHPIKYGFADNSTFGPEPTSMWCNNYHVAPGVHKWFAKDISKLLAFTPW